ncbi:NADH-quinone oxidoreductase subunit M [Roseomonas sp. GC11]|uniref:NADH-quinone oxidoreductase subunit M n=1 Tax=Roseomonas sp. GC11 TaxID=2950546 RepID=UPI00210A0F7E|nr:NADH-quinone oxidoreductase subunit M [Roseomonas sp. GC11]MCQ4160006.1 NADH-quinone oxidoreductase subunit M [Roseomonas sp. GC11]
MMAADFPLLSLLVALPFLGIGALLLARGEGEEKLAQIRLTALLCSLVTFALSLMLWFGFDKSQAGYQFEERHAWQAAAGISYHMGVDGLSVLFVLLTTVMTPIGILASWRATRSGLREYMIAFLLLESMLVGVFSAVDLTLFYLFFEGAMIPVFLIIGAWGGPGRVRAAMKLFLYTMVGMLLMLLAILTLWRMAGSTDLTELLQLQLSRPTQIWLFLAFLAAFGVKMPMWPAHTWQPDAYSQAPTGGSVMLAGVMLNMGAYGFLRFAIPLFPQAVQALSPVIFTLAVIAIIYASLVAMAQKDMKRLVAYSSVAHMGIITVGLFAVSQESLSGALLQMLSHGVATAAMFLCIGVLSDRARTHELDQFGGLAKAMPGFAAVFMLFTMASIALPGTGDFPGEVLVVFGAWKTSPWIALGIVTSMVLGACYMLYLYRRVLFGRLVREDLRALADLSPREVAMFAPLALLTLWIGIYPSSFLGFFQASVAALVSQQQAALAATARLAGL